MARRTTAIKVFIASPGDVEEERRIVRKVVDKWNARNSDRQNILLHAVGWETHGVPMQGQQAQSRINETVLADCDLLIGIFHSRVGTPTTDFVSGAVEEIETHAALNKRAMVYFSNAPVPKQADSVEHERVAVLRSKYELTSWVGRYDTPEHFESLFFEHLTETMNDTKFIESLRETLTGTDVPEMRAGEAKITESNLTNEELQMLQAANEQGASISRSKEIGRPTICAGKVSYGSRDRRDFERGLSILNKLISRGLVDDRSGFGEVYVITHDGYTALDRAEISQSSQTGLSDDALQLLIAAGDPDSPGSTILFAYRATGPSVVVGDKDFDASSPKEYARWESAIEELKFSGYVKAEERGVYSFTHVGYQAAEELFQHQK